MQACAKQILGLNYVQFPPQLRKICNGKFSYLYPDQHGRGGRPHKWRHEFGKNQWWIDALTIDPSHMLGGRGLWEKGKPQPVCSTALENASVGSLPAVMVYLAAHPVHGTRAFYPYHGAKHGSVCDSETGEKSLFRDFEYWFDSLGEKEKEEIRDLGYFNTPASIKKFEEQNKDNPAELELFRKGPFHPRWFMVRNQ